MKKILAAVLCLVLSGCACRKCEPKPAGWETQPRDEKGRWISKEKP